jgi:CubicO group peptidase (beta-lactamase class C family)
LKRFIIVKLVILVSLIGTNVLAQTKVNKLNDFFSALANNQDFNGNVLVAENGKILYEKSFGYADFSSKRINTVNTLFPIASITKTFTATAILQQIEKGKLRLTDSAAEYLHDFPYPKITIRHLLSHTSGIPPYNVFFSSLREANPNRIFTNADFLSGLNANKSPLVYQPGESWNYDNTNYIVLALILEKVSGESYGEYIKKHILRPAGMNHTVFFPFLFDSSKNKIKNLAIPHWYPQIYADQPIKADSIQYVSSYWRAYQFSGFGDFISTTRDLLKYDQALYDGMLVSQRLLNEAFVPVKLNNGKENPGNYGLGWTIGRDNSRDKVVYHVGGSIGLNCVLYRNVSRNQTVIAFDLARPSAHYAASSAIRILNGEPVSLPKKNLTRLYGKILVTKGSEAAAEALEKLGKDAAVYDLEKEELIKLGYEFLGDVNPFRLPVEPKYEEAVEVFKMCVRLFPDYWNSYDSYADVLARTGKRELAIKMYQKSIELNPNNESGKKRMEQLLDNKNKQPAN